MINWKKNLIEMIISSDADVYSDVYCACTSLNMLFIMITKAMPTHQFRQMKSYLLSDTHLCFMFCASRFIL